MNDGWLKINTSGRSTHQDMFFFRTHLWTSAIWQSTRWLCHVLGYVTGCLWWGTLTSATLGCLGYGIYGLRVLDRQKLSYLSKWVITPVMSGLTLLIPCKSLGLYPSYEGMSHQVLSRHVPSSHGFWMFLGIVHCEKPRCFNHGCQMMPPCASFF